MSKTRVAIICGGKSGEHEVSLQSAKNIIEAIDRDKYEVVVIGIDKTGRWALYPNDDFLLHQDDPERIQLKGSGQWLSVAPGGGRENGLVRDGLPAAGPIDVVFPVLHGPCGEDGTVQGLFYLANLPFVGAGVLGSAVGMDKDVMKRLFRDAGIPIADFQVLHRHARNRIRYEDLAAELGLPFFVKPANYGSSIGVAKIHHAMDFQKALDEAFRCDRKVLVEEAIQGREIECSVLGNEEPAASLPGEIIPRHDFYSYQAKYIDDSGARLIIPAKLAEPVVQRIQELAVRSFQVLCCEGMARVDFFLKDNQQLIVNEINTIPGFTRISMYPKLWEVSGISYPDLIDRLIQLALARFEQESQITAGGNQG